MASTHKKVDPRIRTLLENGIQMHHRSFFVLVGDRGRDQVINLHHMLSKAIIGTQPSVLWCYKSELGFSSNRQKRMRSIKRKQKMGLIDADSDDPFELFLTTTKIRWTFYKDTHKVLGNTYGMCVLQDFEAITPNILARTIETVEGGGVIVLLLKTMTNLQQLYNMAMDVHKRFKTEAHQEVTARFNERFLLSLVACEQSLVVDDELNILPLSVASRKITPLPPKKPGSLTPSEKELKALKAALADTQPVGAFVKLAKTLDQAKSLVTFIDAISEKSLRSTVSLTAARGRGKSAALGLAIAAAVSYGYSNIFVTSPSPENLKTLFDFVFKGFDALDYTEHTDYELIQSANPALNKAIVRVNIFRSHRQVIQYIAPDDSSLLAQAELVVIDEAAAIPLPMVRKLLGPYLVFMSSTINGYEGTGRSLSLKLLKELRERSGKSGERSAGGRQLREIKLSDPIRYSKGDSVEKWLNGLLCLDATVVKPIHSGAPHPSACELYYVNRDTLFSYHKVSEVFLQRMMALYVSSHYKNSPNDLLLMSDAPAHHLFVLHPRLDSASSQLPDIFCVLQVALEGQISAQSVTEAASSAKRPAGDLIPWNVSQQFQDHNFPKLSGARVVRIATHADFQKMGYGSRALSLLHDYYSGNITDMSEEVPTTVPVSPPAPEASQTDLQAKKLRPRRHLPPLFVKLSERPPERLHYVGVSFGLTPSLFGFWKKAGYLPVYLRLTELATTGEHTCIMLKPLVNVTDSEQFSDKWMFDFYDDFARRFVQLLGYSFRKFRVQTAMSVLGKERSAALLEGKKTFFGSRAQETPTKADLDLYFSSYDLARLTSYTKNLLDYHAIVDLLPVLAKLFFTGVYSDALSLSAGQVCILIGVGLQFKSIDEVAKELGIQTGQVLALFSKIIRKFSRLFDRLEVADVDAQLGSSAVDVSKFAPTATTLEDDLEANATEVSEKMKEKQTRKQKNLLSSLALPEYAIQGGREDWEAEERAAQRSKVPTMVSIKRKLETTESERPKKKLKRTKSHDSKKKRRSSGKKT
eukprot:TRINITY_DN3410_c0_g1_i1.p1 TRINITY_DN3410_c0_g1~~TRINITY_DN3410_c0_g1_i1.p1  ORF type:complete len:1037 (+),score=299.15 TRINITY_DN3410_c0_g1_i1:74-3184(+)